jgi:AcrR family transcriptional regulator
MPGRAPHLGPARRREPVLDAAATVFAEGGFSAASMAAIAGRAGVAKAVLYDCFPGGKRELYEALLDRGQRAFVAHLDSVRDRSRGRGLEGGLRQGLCAFLDYADVDPAGFRVIFGPAGTADPAIVRRSQRVREAIVRRIADGASSALAGLPAELFARAVVAIAEEVARWTVRRPDLPRDELVELLVRWFVHGAAALAAG